MNLNQKFLFFVGMFLVSLLMIPPMQNVSAFSPVDSDGDGINDDQDNCPNIANQNQLDFNNDGLGDVCSDSDGDGINDDQDNCPNIANQNQLDFNNDGLGDVCSDSDGDGINDDQDNCPNIANQNQLDFNNDGLGDVCSDSDGDGINDDQDNCPNIANQNQLDFNNDGLGDVCSDSDGDGINDDQDNCPNIANQNQLDFNNDGLGDVCSDSDGDGINDDVDDCPLLDETVNGFEDADGCPDTVPPPILDTISPVITVPNPGIGFLTEGEYLVDYSNQVSATDDVDGVITISCTPPSGSIFAIGTTTVTCSAIDSAGNSATASFSIKITPEDRPWQPTIKLCNQYPAAIDDFVTTEENNPVEFDVEENDYDTLGDTCGFFFEIKSQSSNGNVVLNSASGGISTHGQMTYTPNFGFSGTDYFTYTMISSDSRLRDDATVTINVTPISQHVDTDGDRFVDIHDECPLIYSVTNNGCPDTFVTDINNSPPEYVGPPSISTDMNTPLRFTFVAIDIDGPIDQLGFYITAPQNGWLYAGASTYDTADFLYTPHPGFSGSDSFTVEIYDGVQFGPTITIPVTVGSTTVTNNIPVVTGPSSVSTTQDTPVRFTITATDDSKPDKFVHFTPNSYPQHGTLDFVPESQNGNQHDYIYTPNTGFSGSDSFGMQVSDGELYSEILIISIQVSSKIVIIDCDEGFHQEGERCVPDIVTCTTGYHLEVDVCVPDKTTIICPSGQVYVGNSCVKSEFSCQPQYIPEGKVCVPSDENIFVDPSAPIILFGNFYGFYSTDSDKFTGGVGDPTHWLGLRVFDDKDLHLIKNVDCNYDPDTLVSFPLGKTLYECSVTDSDGNTSTGWTTVRVYGSPEIILSPPPSLVQIGETIEFKGKFTGRGGDELYAGKNIHIGGFVSGITNEHGEFSIPWTGEHIMKWEFQAMSDGIIGGTVLSERYSLNTIPEELEEIRIFLNNNVFHPGEGLTVSASTTPGEIILFELYDMDGNVISTSTPTAHKDGLILNIEIIDWNTSILFGDYIFKASSIYDNGERTAVAYITYSPPPPKLLDTWLTLDAGNYDPEGVLEGSRINFNGYLYQHYSTLAGATIEILAQVDGALIPIITTTTDYTGKYSASWEVDNAGLPETFEIFANYGGNPTFYPSRTEFFTAGTDDQLTQITIKPGRQFSTVIDKTIVIGGSGPNGYTPVKIYGQSRIGDTITFGISEYRNPNNIISLDDYVITDKNGFFSYTFGKVALIDDRILGGTHYYRIFVYSEVTGEMGSHNLVVIAKTWETTTVETNVVYTDAGGRQIPVDGVHVRLMVNDRVYSGYTNNHGIATIENIPVDEFNRYYTYSAKVLMDDGASFGLVDFKKIKINEYSVITQRAPHITTSEFSFDISAESETVSIGFDLAYDLPYISENNPHDTSLNIEVASTFNLQKKVVTFYNKILNERPPMIDVVLWTVDKDGDDAAYYRSTNWNSDGSTQWPYHISLWSNPGISTVGMEYTHYVQDYAYRAMSGYDGTPKGPNGGNHHGFWNESTADSWIEGLGTFMPAVIACYYGMNECGNFDYTSLESNKYTPDSTYKQWADGTYWLDEEYSIATLLWDMYDSKNDNESTSLGIKEIWNLVKEYHHYGKYYDVDNKYDSQRHIKYFKDFYDYTTDHSGLSSKEIKQLFDLHGIPNGYTPGARI